MPCYYGNSVDHTQHHGSLKCTITVLPLGYNNFSASISSGNMAAIMQDMPSFPEMVYYHKSKPWLRSDLSTIVHCYAVPGLSVVDLPFHKDDHNNSLEKDAAGGINSRKETRVEQRYPALLQTRQDRAQKAKRTCMQRQLFKSLHNAPRRVEGHMSYERKSERSQNAC